MKNNATEVRTGELLLAACLCGAMMEPLTSIRCVFTSGLTCRYLAVLLMVSNHLGSGSTHDICPEKPMSSMSIGQVLGILALQAFIQFVAIIILTFLRRNVEPYTATQVICVKLVQVYSLGWLTHLPNAQLMHEFMSSLPSGTFMVTVFCYRYLLLFYLTHWFFSGFLLMGRTAR